MSDLRRVLVEAGAQEIVRFMDNEPGPIEVEGGWDAYDFSAFAGSVLDAMLDKLEEHAAAVPEFDSLPAAYVVSVLREKPQ